MLLFLKSEVKMAYRFAALTLILVGVIACSDQRTPTATAPDVDLRLAANTGTLCSSRLGRTIDAQQLALYSGATLTQAQDLWTIVVRDCKTNLPVAQTEMLSYVQFTIDNAVINGGLSTATASGTVDHWNSVFQYVGYSPPNANSLSLTLKGGAEVVANPSVSEEVRTFGTYAAITIYHQSTDFGTRLVTIHSRGSDTCITGTNLTQRGECFEFSLYPHVNTWDPEPLAGVCQATHDSRSPTGSLNAALGHQPENSNAAQILEPVSYPTFCGEDDVVTFPKDWWNDDLKGIAGRLAYAARKVLVPKPAYASHTGIGGTSLGGGPSPFAPVDRRIFFATLTGNTINAFPGIPERGHWESLIKPPGSILVQSFLGNLDDTLVVLSQAGGNCDKKCSGLQLNGIAAFANNQSASTGVYDVFWDAVEDAPSIKGAPIVIKSTTGKVIASVTLRQVSSVNEILFNNTVVGAWVQHVGNNYHLVIDFTGSTPNVDLYIDGNPIVTDAGFADTAATDIGSIRAEFTGIDSGIFGWDNVLIERRPDSNGN